MIEENKVLSKEQRFEEGRGFIIGETVIAEFEPTVTERYHYKNMNSNEEYDVYIVVTKDIYGNTASGRVSDFLKIDWYRDFGIIDIELSRKGKRILAAAWTGILYAASDEFHQLFVPGRSGQITDVLIDSGGLLAGILLVVLIKSFYIKQSRRS